MTLSGKGMMIWQLPRCEGGNAQRIADEAEKAGLTHVMIKVANGILAYNVDRATNRDLVPPVAEALRSKGIQVWGWHYVYGANPSGEAKIAIQRIKQLGLDGYAIDAEQEYKQPGMATAAKTFMRQLRAGVPNTLLGLSSYRYPKYHPELPWKEFLDYCDYNMPQVYWEQSHNPETQLRRCVEQFQVVSPFREIIPTGPIYKTGGWYPYASEITSFLNTARALNLKAANFFTWDHRIYLNDQWNAMANYPWPAYPIPKDISERFVEALNTRNPEIIMSLYNENAIHITAEKTIQGIDAIKDYYRKFLTERFPNAAFALTGYSGNGNSRHLTWQGTNNALKIENGNDTIGIINGKITYHYSLYTITDK